MLDGQMKTCEVDASFTRRHAGLGIFRQSPTADACNQLIEECAQPTVTWLTSGHLLQDFTHFLILVSKIRGSLQPLTRTQPQNTICVSSMTCLEAVRYPMGARAAGRLSASRRHARC